MIGIATTIASLEAITRLEGASDSRELRSSVILQCSLVVRPAALHSIFIFGTNDTHRLYLNKNSLFTYLVVASLHSLCGQLDVANTSPVRGDTPQCSGREDISKAVKPRIMMESSRYGGSLERWFLSCVRRQQCREKRVVISQCRI